MVAGFRSFPSRISFPLVGGEPKKNHFFQLSAGFASAIFKFEKNPVDRMAAGVGLSTGFASGAYAGAVS